MKSKFIVTLSLMLIMHFVSGQTWNTLGNAQFVSDAKYIASTVDQSNGELYIMYVDGADNDHVKVMKYNGTSWNNVGGTVSAIGNALIPSININPATGEPWVAYRTDINASTRYLVVKRFDGTNWIDEGTNISGSVTAGYRSFINFDQAGNAYVAYSSYYTALYYKAYVMSNKTGSWQNQYSVNHTEPFAYDYPSYDKFYYADMNNGNLRIFKRELDAGGTWSSSTISYSNSNFPPGGFQNEKDFEGLAANTINENFLVKREATGSPVFYTGTHPSGLLASPPSSDDARGKTMQMKFNPVDGNFYILYVNDYYETKVSKFDGSTWTDLTALPEHNYALTSPTATLNIRQSDGRIFVNNVDIDISTYTALGLSSYYMDVTPAPTKYYVDQNATGNNDGSSWTDAFTGIQDGLDALENSLVADSLWIAQGTYKPDASDRTIKYTISGDNTKIFGGFNGTETSLSQRDIIANPTIISGDLSGNDSPNNFSYNSIYRADNSYNLFYVDADNVEINGLTIMGGQANNTNNNSLNRGAAVYKTSGSQNFSIQHCVIKDNISNREGTLYLPHDDNSNLLINACEFANNFGRYASGFNVTAATGGISVDVTIVNSVFYDNVAGDVAAGDAYTGSSFTINMNNGATVNAEIVNNTFFNNYDLSTSGSIDKGTVVLRRYASNDVLNVEMHNNIFWENYSDNSGTINPQIIAFMNGSLPITSLNFTHNNYEQANLSSKASSFTESNNLNSDPLFVNESNFELQLQSGSPMINAGDNNMVPSGITQDIAGTNRIGGSSVDIGAYEAVPNAVPPTVVAQDITVQLDANGQVTIQPSNVDNGSYDDETPQQNLVLSLDVTTFDCSNIGANTVTLTVEDDAGNTASATAQVTIEDDMNPTALTNTLTTISLDASGQAILTASDVDNGSSDNCGIASMSVDVTQFDCSHVGTTQTVNFTVTDNSGNSSTITADVAIVDNIAPSVVTQDITVSLSANGEATISATDIDNSSGDNCGIASMSLDVSNFSCTDLGMNTVTLTVTDASGNSDSETATVTVTDNIDPVAIVNTLTTITVDANGVATLAGTDVDNGSSDNCGIASMDVDVTNFDCSHIGTVQTINFTVADGSGNTATTTADVEIIDNTAPIVETQDITVTLDANGQAAITTTDIDNGSFDNCGIASMTLDVTDFTCNEAGQNTVTLSVTDNSGNTGTGTAIVTVVETEAPIALTQDITIDLDANGEATIVTSDIDNGSYDNCGIASMSLDITNFSCANVGPNTVTLTVTDASGNTDTESAIVNVEDNITPTAIAQDITVQLTGNQVTITAADIDNGSFDNCGIDNLSIDQNTFSAGGTYPVVLTVIDVSGNSASVTAQVTVNSNIGINNEQTEQLSIYPNPIKHEAHITGLTGIKEIVVYNQAGQPIKTTNESRIDLSDFAKGMYFIRVIQNNGVITTSKVVKQ